jgi:hypothetical protein
MQSEGRVLFAWPFWLTEVTDNCQFVPISSARTFQPPRMSE